MSKIIIGVDISKDRLDACRLPDQAARQFDNSKTGIRAWQKWAGKTVDRVIFEPSGPYHRTFEGACARAGLALVEVNPKNARRFAESIGVLAKTDRVDAARVDAGSWRAWVSLRPCNRAGWPMKA